MHMIVQKCSEFQTIIWQRVGIGGHRGDIKTLYDFGQAPNFHNELVLFYNETDTTSPRGNLFS